jgi:phage-related baseplate assembly protein
MKNIAISSSRQAETVAHEELIGAMVPAYHYTQDEVCALLHESPRSAVRDALHALVAKGIVWRDATTSRVRYALLEGDALREAIERKTKRSASPAWMNANLAGYDAEQRRFRDLCMKARN